MYPVSLGYEEAISRINSLLLNGHHAEALLTSVFTTEKTVKRTLRFLAISRGFTSKQADVLFKNNGFHDLKKVWPCFEKSHRTLPEMLGTHWQHIEKAVTMRNKMAHGERVYKLSECQLQAEQVLRGLQSLRNILSNTYNFDGWSKMPIRRTPALEWIEIRPVKKDPPPKG